MDKTAIVIAVLTESDATAPETLRVVLNFESKVQRSFDVCPAAHCVCASLDCFFKPLVTLRFAEPRIDNQGFTDRVAKVIHEQKEPSIAVHAASYVVGCLFWREEFPRPCVGVNLRKMSSLNDHKLPVIY
jgi:hypothetical protein